LTLQRVLHKKLPLTSGRKRRALALMKFLAGSAITQPSLSTASTSLQTSAVANLKNSTRVGAVFLHIKFNP